MSKLLTILAVVAPLVLASPAVASTRCEHSNIDGDHITAANDFQVRGGISCANAFMSATGYTDSPADTLAPSTDRFTAEFYEWRYRWTCRVTEMTKHELHAVHAATTYGTRFNCHAEEELGGRRKGTVYMRFKWWLGESRECPSFPLEYEVNKTPLASEVSVSRSVSCKQGREWLTTVSEDIQFNLNPYKVTNEQNETENPENPSEPHGVETVHHFYYRLFYGGEYECDVSPTKLSASGFKTLECQPSPYKWGSKSYTFDESE